MDIMKKAATKVLQNTQVKQKMDHTVVTYESSS